MKQPSLVIAGPFVTQPDAIRAGVAIYGFWPAASDTRRHRRGWYLYARSEATNHVGSKRWRRWVRHYYRTHPHRGKYESYFAEAM